MAEEDQQDQDLPSEPQNPGPINCPSQIQALCISDNNYKNFMPLSQDPFANMNLKPASEIQENAHYVILNDKCFQYLYGIYGGTDIRRVSIELQTLDEAANGT